MVLVDIGNSFFHILKDNKIIHSKEITSFDDEVFYISVNKQKEELFLDKNPDAINLKDYVKFDTNYKNLGIDRIMACKSISNGVVVDAGSAITIDVMKNFKHLGGVIMLGLSEYKNSFKRISSVLELKDFQLNSMPLSTNEALSMGSLGSVICLIEKYREDNVYITGGDGEIISKFIKDSIYIPDLVFRGMIKTIKEDL